MTPINQTGVANKMNKQSGSKSGVKHQGRSLSDNFQNKGNQQQIGSKSIDVMAGTMNPLQNSGNNYIASSFLGPTMGSSKVNGNTQGNTKQQKTIGITLNNKISNIYSGQGNNGNLSCLQAHHTRNSGGVQLAGMAQMNVAKTSDMILDASGNQIQGKVTLQKNANFNKTMGHGGFMNEGQRDTQIIKKNGQRSHSNNVPNTYDKTEKNKSHGRLPSQGNQSQIYNK